MNADNPLEAPAPRRGPNARGQSTLAFRIATQPELRDWMLSRIGAAAFPEDGQATPPLRALDAADPDGFVFALINAWAAVGDNLAFYQERIVNEGYLATATEALSVRALNRSVGYEPGPALSARTWLAFTLDGRGGPRKLAIPRGVSVQSIPRPGESPVTFETDADLDVAMPAWNAMSLLLPPPVVEPAVRNGTTALRVAGVRKVLQPDSVLILVSNVAGAPPPAIARRLTEVTPNIPQGYTDIAWGDPLQIIDDQWEGRAPGQVYSGPAYATPPPAAPPHPDFLVCGRSARLFGANAPAWDAQPDAVKARLGSRAGATRVSPDAGQTWGANATGLAAGDVSAVAIHGAGDGSAYAVASDGVFRLPPGAGAWSSLTRPLPGSRLTALAIGSSGALIVGSQRGDVFRSDDAGVSWYPLAGAPGQVPPAGQSARLPTTPVTALLSVPMAAGEDAILAGAGSGVWRLAGPGGAWISLSEGLGGGARPPAATAPKGAARSPGPPPAAPSARAAAPAVATTPGTPRAVTPAALADSVAALTAALARLRPPAAASGSTIAAAPAIAVRSLCVHRGLLIAATDQGLFHAVAPPAAVAWRRATLPAGQGPRIADVQDLTSLGGAGPVFAATAGGLLRSNDGLTWVTRPAPVDGAGAPVAFGALAATTGRLVGAADSGVYVSEDLGDTWRALNPAEWGGKPVVALAAAGDMIAVCGKFTGYADRDWPGIRLTDPEATAGSPGGGDLEFDLDRGYAGLETGSWIALMGEAGGASDPAAVMKVTEVSKRTRRDFGTSAIVTHVTARLSGPAPFPIDPRATSVELLTQPLDVVRFTYDQPRVLIFPGPAADGPPAGGLAGDPADLDADTPLPPISLNGAIEGLAGRTVAITGQPARLRIVGRLGGVRMANVNRSPAGEGKAAPWSWSAVGHVALNTNCLLYSPVHGLVLGTPFNIQSLPARAITGGTGTADGDDWALFGQNLPLIDCYQLIEAPGLALSGRSGPVPAGWSLLAATAQGIWVGGRTGSDPAGWLQLTDDLDDGEPRAVHAIRVVGGELIAGAARGIFSSVDGGHSWTNQWRPPAGGAASGDLPQGAALISLAATASGDIIAGTADGAVLRRASGEATWSAVTVPPVASHVWALAVTPTGTPARVFAATDNGLFGSADGDRWTAEPMPPGPRDVRAVAADPRGQPWSAVRGRGVLDGAGRIIHSAGIGNDISSLLFVGDVLIVGSRLGAPLPPADGSVGPDLTEPRSQGVISSPFLADWLNNEGPVTDEVRRMFQQPGVGVALPPEATITKLPDAALMNPQAVSGTNPPRQQGAWRIGLPDGVELTVTYVGEDPTRVPQYRLALAAALSIDGPPSKPDPADAIDGSVTRWTLKVVVDERVKTVTLDVLPGDVGFGPASESAPTATEIAAIRTADIAPDRLGTAIALDRSLTQVFDATTVSINANVVSASHGATAASARVIGSGDNSAGQSFVLTSSPVSVLPKTSGEGVAYQVNLGVRTSGAQGVIALSAQLALTPGQGLVPSTVPWRQVDSLDASSPTDADFTVSQDEAGQTRVNFGDGVNGRRLPTGQDNVIASYRVGGGEAGNLEAGRLTLLTRRPTGVKSVTNPAPAVGGADGAPPGDIRFRGPVGARALGRTVSKRDLEPFLLARPGVAKARLTEMAVNGRPVLHFTVAFAADAATPAGSRVLPPPQGSLSSLLAAITASGPRKPAIRLSRYQPAWFELSASIQIDPLFEANTVIDAAQAALADRFGFQARRLAEPARGSDVVQCLQAVEGVVAVFIESLHRRGTRPDRPTVLAAQGAAQGPNGFSGAELLLLSMPATLSPRGAPAAEDRP